jgi:hypothetical protein
MRSASWPRGCQYFSEVSFEFGRSRRSCADARDHSPRPKTEVNFRFVDHRCIDGADVDQLPADRQKVDV